MMKYPDVVEAARAIGQDKKRLAESLFEAIPPRGKGRRPAGEATDPEMFEEAADEIFAETGERYAADTLRQYRDVAKWVAGNLGPQSQIPWADASWTAHREAYKNGESFASFAKNPATKRRVRERNGGATGDVPAAARAINTNPAEATKLVADLNPEAIKAVAKAALDEHPDLGEPPSTPEGRAMREKLERQNRATENFTLKLLQAVTLIQQCQEGWLEYYQGLGEQERKEADHALHEIYVMSAAMQMNAALDNGAFDPE